MAIPSLASDLDSVLQHGGVAVTIGVVSSYGKLRTEKLEAYDEGSGKMVVVGQRTTLTVRDGTFSGLGQDVAATVDGVSYKIRDPGVRNTDGTRTLTVVPASP
jgi:hypothetical protein